jgi:hypothetical protein
VSKISHTLVTFVISTALVLIANQSIATPIDFKRARLVECKVIKSCTIDGACDASASITKQTVRMIIVEILPAKAFSGFTFFLDQGRGGYLPMSFNEDQSVGTVVGKFGTHNFIQNGDGAVYEVIPKDGGDTIQYHLTCGKR